MTCEKIREDALQELEAKHSNTNAVNERRNAELKYNSFPVKLRIVEFSGLSSINCEGEMDSYARETMN